MVLYVYSVPGVAEPLALKPGFWRQHLLQGEVRLPREGRQFSVRLADGSSVTARFQRVLLGFDVPELIVGDATYAYAPRLPVWVALWCFLPVALVLIGGLIPVVIGLVAAIGNLRVMRAPAPVAVKAAISIAINATATGVVIGIGVALTHLLKR